MPNRKLQCAMTALAASLLLAAAVGTASARNLSVSNQSIRATWNSIEMNAEEFAIIRCKLTLEGSFHTRTITKTPGTLIGAITKAQFKQETCTNGIFATFNGTERYNGVTPTNTLPWHLTYESFTGRLPAISGVQFLLSRFRLGVRDNAALCTGQYGVAADNITTNAAISGGAITSITPIEGGNSMTLFRRDGGLLCAGTMRIQGAGAVMLLGNTTRITITLI